jgi:hypothetical protein
MTMTAGQARGKYRKGTAFERKIRDALHEAGYAVARGAGSKGSSKADLVAFGPQGAILVIQAKTNGVISASEWDRLYDVAMYSARLVQVATRTGVESIMFQPVTPIIAYKGDRGRLIMDEITGHRVHRKPRENRRRYEWRCLCEPPHDDLSKLDKMISQA